MKIKLKNLTQITVLGEDNSYSIDIQIEGFTGIILRQLLFGQDAGQVKLGQSGAPTQFDIDAALAAWKRAKVPATLFNDPDVELDL